MLNLHEKAEQLAKQLHDEWASVGELSDYVRRDLQGEIARVRAVGDADNAWHGEHANGALAMIETVLREVYLEGRASGAQE